MRGMRQAQPIAHLECRAAVNSERIQLEVWWVQPECVFPAKDRGRNLMFEGESGGA
jgi:hypothetical protein